jgi:pyruvate,orthophosphate dikinase
MFFHSIGVDSVSCSPFRIPIAKLAAAQGAILDGYIASARSRLRPSG